MTMLFGAIYLTQLITIRLMSQQRENKHHVVREREYLYSGTLTNVRHFSFICDMFFNSWLVILLSSGSAKLYSSRILQSL